MTHKYNEKIQKRQKKPLKSLMNFSLMVLSFFFVPTFFHLKFFNINETITASTTCEYTFNYQNRQTSTGSHKDTLPFFRCEW